MTEFSIRDKCKVNSNLDTDTFVGIKCENGEFSVHFPLGFSISDTDKELRKDILLLINTIAATTQRKESEIEEKAQNFNHISFPFQAYLYLIYDFYGRGYYLERETKYNNAKRGKIDWNRTIKTQKAYVQDENVFYLDFVTKKNSIKDDEMITLIHQYCVYDAFCKIGWLYTNQLPEKSRLKYNEKLFRSIVLDKLRYTFNDKNKILFTNMLAVINYLGDENAGINYKYGTYRFEYVWEAIIDRVFGISNKEDYYPKTTWNIAGRSVEVNDSYENSSLRPDSIMLYNGNIYVLDAKYYKYGAYKNPGMLPKSTDINKQITYGEYIAGQEKFKIKHGENYEVYNAFIMPFDRTSKYWKGSNSIVRIGQAVGNWKENKKAYENVQGILVDLKYLMKISVRQDEEEICKLAKIIEAKIGGLK